MNITFPPVKLPMSLYVQLSCVKEIGQFRVQRQHYLALHLHLFRKFFFSVHFSSRCLFQKNKYHLSPKPATINQKTHSFPATQKVIWSYLSNFSKLHRVQMRLEIIKEKVFFSACMKSCNQGKSANFRGVKRSPWSFTTGRTWIHPYSLFKG